MLSGSSTCPCKVALSDLREVAKGLASVLCVVDMCDFPAVDLQVALTPGGDVDFKFLVSDVATNS